MYYMIYYTNMTNKQFRLYFEHTRNHIFEKSNKINYKRSGDFKYFYLAVFIYI